MTKFFKNEEGSGLILSLMTLLVLSVLGVSLGTISLGGHRLSGVNRDSSSAYYIAEAGANMAYEEIEKIVTEAYAVSSNKDAFESILNEQIPENFKKYESGVFSTQFGKQPEADIRVYYESNENIREYTIDSKANIGNHNRTAQKKVAVTWFDKNPGSSLPPLPEGTALIARNKIKFTNGQIVGDVYFDSLEPGSFEISGSGTVRSNTSNIYVPGSNFERIYKSTSDNPPLELFRSRTSKIPVGIDWDTYDNILDSFPEFNVNPPTNYPELDNDIIFSADGHNSHLLINNGNIFHNSWIKDDYLITLSGNTTFKNIEVASEKKLTINTGNQDLNISLENLYINHGTVTFEGTGNLNLFIKNDFLINGNSNTDTLVVKGYKEINIYTNNYTHQNGNSKTINTDKISIYVKNNLDFVNGEINKGSSSHKYLLYYEKNEPIKFGGDIKINASMFFKESSLIIGAGSSLFGPILTGGSTVSLSGGSDSSPLIIAPNAIVTAGNGTFTGFIIGKEFDISGGMDIISKHYDSKDFPFGTLGSLPTPEPEDIINSDPAIEP